MFGLGTPDIILILVLLVIAILLFNRLYKRKEKSFRDLSSLPSIRGTVRKFTQRTTILPNREAQRQAGIKTGTLVINRTINIWNFRIERYDDNNDLLPSVQIEIKGEKIIGSITDGDEVEVYYKNWNPNFLMEPVWAYNHTSKSEIRAEDYE